MNKYLIIGFFVFVTGCACDPQIKTVTKTELKPIDIGDTLLRPCPVTTPPNKDEYVELTAEQKEEVLTNYTVSLIKDLGICNSQIANIKSTRDQQLKVYQDLNAKQKQE